MAFMKISSPHAHKPGHSTGWVMRQVILATLPGVAAMTYFFGWGTLINIALASVLAIAFEALVLKIRKRPLGFYLQDYSALVTAVLLGIALPPYAPWWLIAVGIGFAIFIAKHLYGGLGFNPFNPAMVGYVVLLISFPVEMTSWAAPRDVVAEAEMLSFVQALQATFGFDSGVDAYTMATPLDVFKQNNTETVSALWSSNETFGLMAGYGWEWCSLGFLLGGLYLIYRRIYTWHAPISMLVSLTLVSALFYDGGSSASGGSPLYHLFAGATMFGAFFIITDPVSSATSIRGRVVFGAIAGVLIFLVRSYGNYPDGVAFSVLLVNFAAPFIDYYTQPRTYGQIRPKRGTEKKE